jgi:REP element-mobilizing transposase RayT
LRDYDYSHAGAYFVTICAWQRECLFGEVVDGGIRLSAFGEIVQEEWQRISAHFSGVDVDQCVIMPNHFHGIVSIVGAGSPRPGLARNVVKNQINNCGEENQGGETPPLRVATLGQIVGYFKYQSTKHINQLRNNPCAPVWQRNYYERVIRDEVELHSIRQYIIDNPIKWPEDENHPLQL